MNNATPAHQRLYDAIRDHHESTGQPVPCRVADVHPDLWYDGGDTERAAYTARPDREKRQDITYARTVSAVACGGCPLTIRTLCLLAGAHEEYGVWGGLTAEQRHGKRVAA